MRFDYNIGKDATFDYWVSEGCKKAEELMELYSNSKPAHEAEKIAVNM